MPAPATAESTSEDGPGPIPYVPSPPVDIAAAIKAAYLNAENEQGPLDGRWQLSSADGVALFAFVMADTGGAPSRRAVTPSNPEIEGAWRDLRRVGAADDSGLLTSVQHIADTVEIRFYDPNASAVVLVKMHADASGVWSGDLVEAGASTSVVMRRS